MLILELNDIRSGIIMVKLVLYIFLKKDTPMKERGRKHDNNSLFKVELFNIRGSKSNY